MGYRYTEDRSLWPSNQELYSKTHQIPWSVKISKRRISFFGHICRLPEETPAKIALKEAIRKSKRPRGKPKTTYIKVIENQLKEKNIKSIEEAIRLAQNRQIWRVLLYSSWFEGQRLLSSVYLNPITLLNNFL